ncbi:MAG: xanthine dehydrogenase accessory protein XdhC [Paracoccaceae bacterium]|nr:xanthine dehydrogenase accessory protein XdhC [Paracoccaceae bacterium]
MRIADLVRAVETEGQAVFVIVADARGSVPRETGAGMVVTPTHSLGTIGGGTVEHRAIEEARGIMGTGSSGNIVLDFPLGPALDQCCGGNMQVGFAVFGAEDLERLSAAGGVLELWKGGPVFRDPAEARTVLTYGAGHVGTALVHALAPLPFRVRWIDARLDAFPQQVPLGVETVTTPLPEAQAKAAPADALHVVLTHSHALDMEIVSAVMERGDFGYLGLIGSATKRALFLRRLRERGIGETRLARLVCPIGLPGLKDKRPTVIAASVAAELLQVVQSTTQISRESA